MFRYVGFNETSLSAVIKVSYVVLGNLYIIFGSDLIQGSAFVASDLFEM